MGDTPIEWTDATWNPVTGCTLISPGCEHCYAKRFSERFRNVEGHPFRFGYSAPQQQGRPVRSRDEFIDIIDPKRTGEA